MGLRKKWAFDKIDWDAEIAEGSVHIDKSDYDSMNATEMVEILNLRGIRAHRGMTRKALRLLLEKGETQKLVHPLDPLRDRITAFLQKHWDRIRDQMVVHCNGNCYEHHDVEVLVCYMASKDILDKQ